MSWACDWSDCFFFNPPTSRGCRYCRPTSIAIYNINFSASGNSFPIHINIASGLLIAVDMSSQVTKAARRVSHELHGVVVSAGLMQKTVKVRVAGQKWNKIVNKVRRLSNLPLMQYLIKGFLLTAAVLRRPKTLPRSRPKIFPSNRRCCCYCARLANVAT